MSDLLQKWESMLPDRCQFQRSDGAGVDLFDQASNGGDEAVLEAHPEHPVGRLTGLGPGALPEKTPHLREEGEEEGEEGDRRGRQKRETEEGDKRRQEEKIAGWQKGRSRMLGR
jgi:hypothetical protein